MYYYKTYKRFLPLMVSLHAGMGLAISIHPKIKITINNDPKWLVITKVTLYSGLWGVTYPVTFFMNGCIFLYLYLR